MNPADENLPTIDPAELDLLVDGELADPDRRELLKQLDRTEGGWRSCALAFLEAQCWKNEFRAAARQERPASPAKSPRRRWLTETKGTILAMAASFLLTLGLVPVVRNAWFAPSGASGEAEVASMEPGAKPGGAPSLVNPPSRAPQVAFEPPSSPKSPSARAVSPWQMATIALPDEEGRLSEAMQVPVRSEERLDASWLRPSPDVLPKEVREEFKRRGIQVRQSRQLIPAPMDDGRRVVIPVDQVELHYVGNRGVQ